MLIYILLFIFLVAGSSSAVQEDVLAKQAAVVQAGKTSIPDLLAKYEEMMRREPRNPLGYVLAAAVYDREESKALYEKALSLSPDYAPARVGLARYYLRRENAPAAWQEYQKAVTLMPDDRSVRLEAIRAAVRASRVNDAKTLAGEDAEFKLEIVHSLIDREQFDQARTALSELGLETDTSGPALNARARLTYLEGQKKNDPQRLQQGIDQWLEAWRQAPELALFYQGAYPRWPLTQLLSRARRFQEVQPVLEKGVTLFPHEYALYENLWKAMFAEPKADYTAERAAVRRQVDGLLKTHTPSAELFRVAALGYTMADAPEEAERLNERLVAEFPYSMAAMMRRRSQAVKTKDLRQKLALLEKFNRDFPTQPAYSEAFSTLEELKVPDAELLKAAEEYLQRVNYPHALLQIGEAFLRRNIYLDRVNQWINEMVKSDAARDAGEARLLAMKGRVLVAQGRAAEVEKIVRPLLDAQFQGYSNVDRGKAKFALAEALQAQNRLEEALEMYAQGFVESQRYVKESGEKFENLYRQLRGSGQGMAEYLAAREGQFQVAASAGIERGTRIDKPMPDFDLLSLTGERVTLASLRGKVVIMNFWATWCGPCRLELPHVQEFYEKTKNDPGVAVVAVTTDENRALVAPFMRQFKYTFPVLFDEGLRAKLEIRGIPTTFIIDPAGMIRLRMVGFNAHEPLVPYLEKLVADYRTTGAASHSNGSAQTALDLKTTVREIEHMPRSGMSEAAWQEAKKTAALDALAKLGDTITGENLYYAAKLESLTGQWVKAAGHLQAYFALPESSDPEARTNRLRGRSELMEAFIRGGLLAEGEKYYASSPMDLAIFVDRQGQHDRAIEILDAYLRTNPPADHIQRSKSLILILLGSANQADEMARRLEDYRDAITPNALANAYSRLAQLYEAAGDQAKSEKYTNLLFALSKSSGDGKGVDSVVNAHIGMVIKKLEGAGGQAKLNDFLGRVRMELAGKKMVMDYLNSRDTFRAVLNKPARELAIDAFLNGQPTDLKSLRGRVVLLDFFAHWCGPCIAGFPFLRDLQRKYESQGLTVLGLSGIYGYYRGERPLTQEQELKRMQEHFVKEYKVTWPMIFEKERTNQKNYGVSYIPHLVLIDRAGVVRYATVGNEAKDELERQIIKLLAESSKPGSHE